MKKDTQSGKCHSSLLRIAFLLDSNFSICPFVFSTRDCYSILFTRTWQMLRYIMMHSCIWINFQSSFSIATCFRLLVFFSSFLLFYSSFFMYFFSSPDQRNTCKFTLCCVFGLVHQSLRNIVIYFLSVEPLFLYCHCHCWSSNIDFKCVWITSWSLQLK